MAEANWDKIRSDLRHHLRMTIILDKLIKRCDETDEDKGEIMKDAEEQFGIISGIDDLSMLWEQHDRLRHAIQILVDDHDVEMREKAIPTGV